MGSLERGGGGRGLTHLVLAVSGLDSGSLPSSPVGTAAGQVWAWVRCAAGAGVSVRPGRRGPASLTCVWQRGTWGPGLGLCPPVTAVPSGQLLPPRASRRAPCTHFQLTWHAKPRWALGTGTPGPDVGPAPPPPDLFLGVGQERQSRPCGQSISVLISWAPRKGLAEMGHLGPRPRAGVSWAAAPPGVLPPAASPRAQPCPGAARSLPNAREAGDTSQNPAP